MEKCTHKCKSWHWKWILSLNLVHFWCCMGSKPFNVYLVLYFNFTHQIRLLYIRTVLHKACICKISILAGGNASKMSLLMKARLTVLFTCIDFSQSELIQSNYRFWMKCVVPFSLIAFNAEIAQVFNIVGDHIFCSGLLFEGIRT